MESATRGMLGESQHLVWHALPESTLNLTGASSCPLRRLRAPNQRAFQNAVRRSRRCHIVFMNSIILKPRL